MYNTVKEILRYVNKAFEIIVFYLGSTIIALIVTALTLSAVTRYVSGNGYDWFIELPPILICWLVFPLLGPLLRNGQHIQVDFLSSILSLRKVLILKLLNNCVVLFGGILFFRAGIDATVLYYNMGQMLEIELAVPMWWMYLAFPTGFFILVSFSLELIISDLDDLLNLKRKAN